MGGIFSQMTLNKWSSSYMTHEDTDFKIGQWHLVFFFFRKMILMETWYKTHNGKLLAIVKAFKTWRHYFKSCKHESLVLINYNNLRYFINTKNLSSCQV